MKKTPLKRHGKRLFSQSEEDKLYWDWFKGERRACDVCGRWPASCAHLLKRGSGGQDRNNLVYLCEDYFGVDGQAIKGCHSKQEGRTQAFMDDLKRAETPVNLYAKARDYTERFDRKRREGF